MRDLVRIKICGLRREADAEAVNEGGAEYAGFVFAPSRRQVTAREAEALRRWLADSVQSVGVFVDSPPEEIAALYKAGVIGLAQLHGAETPAYISRLKALCAVPVIKALRAELARPAAAGCGADAGAARSLAGANIAPGRDGLRQLAAPYGAADFLLFDHGPGGTGAAFDWALLAEPPERPWFLAGGVNLDNIGAALTLRPWAVDVSSGAETGGWKDHAKILALCAAAHSA